MEKPPAHKRKAGESLSEAPYGRQRKPAAAARKSQPQREASEHRKNIIHLNPHP